LKFSAEFNWTSDTGFLGTERRKVPVERAQKRKANRSRGNWDEGAEPQHTRVKRGETQTGKQVVADRRDLTRKPDDVHLKAENKLKNQQRRYTASEFAGGMTKQQSRHSSRGALSFLKNELWDFLRIKTYLWGKKIRTRSLTKRTEDPGINPEGGTPL